MSDKTKKTNIVTIVVVVVILIGFAIYFIVNNKTATGDRISDSEAELNEKLDDYFAKTNKELPREIASGFILDSSNRDGKVIYIIYTVSNENLNSLMSDEVIARMLSKTCNIKTQKKSIDGFGYSYVFVYNTHDRKDVFRTVADKKTCAKYW